VIASQNVFVNEGIFGVLDSGEISTETADWSNGLAAPMLKGAFITTGINTGYVRVAALAQDAPPSEQEMENWEEIVEVSVHAPAGRLRVESLEFGPVPDAELSPSGPGWYRLRVHARGRGRLPDKVSMEPVEDYLLIAWPAARDDAVIQKSSECQSLRTVESFLCSQPHGEAGPVLAFVVDRTLEIAHAV
jgi:hypothetical protein